MGRSRVTDDQSRAAAEHAQNLRQLLEAVGLVGRGGNYALYRRRLLQIGVTDSRFQPAPRVAEPVREDLVRAAAEVRSVAAVCRALGLPTQGRWNRRVRDLLDREVVDTTHFLGQRSNLGRRDLPPRGRPLEELLRQGSRIGSAELKRRLVRAAVLEPRCSCCGRDEWLGGPIPLELDHVNGVGDDNRLVNLRLLCPNCHALTDTYRGRNVGRQPYAEKEPP